MPPARLEHAASELGILCIIRLAAAILPARERRLTTSSRLSNSSQMDRLKFSQFTLHPNSSCDSHNRRLQMPHARPTTLLRVLIRPEHAFFRRRCFGVFLDDA